MSSSWVIDASIGFAWVHPDQATTETERLLQEIEAGTRVVVPMLWYLEVANGLLVLQRRRKLTSKERRLAMETLSGLNLIADDESYRAAFRKTSELAEKYGLSVYDAVYLETAMRRRLPLASCDQALLAAARRCGIKTLTDPG
jgi:predicted nucleic acid-binding protein